MQKQRLGNLRADRSPLNLPDFFFHFCLRLTINEASTRSKGPDLQWAIQPWIVIIIIMIIIIIIIIIIINIIIIIIIIIISKILT